MTEHQYQQFRKNGIIEKVCVRIASTFASNASSSCYVSLQDIQDVFPDAQRFKLDDLPIPFLIDSNGNRIEPLRIAFYPYKILDVVTEVSRPSNSNSNAVIRLPTLRSSANLAAQEPLLPLSNSIQSFNSLLTTRDNAQIEETNSNLEKVAELLLGAKEKDDKMNNLMAEIREKDDKMSHLLSEIKEKDDKVNNLILEAKEKDIEMLKLRDKMLQLQEKVHNLQDRVLEPQLEAKERGERMQRQDRDRLSLIQNHAHAILAQRFELYDCPIPQLFIILPADCTRWDPINVLKNKVRLHFLCEGTTESPIHIGYEGYEIRNSTRFFQKYGEHIFILLQWLKLRQSSSAGIDCSIEYMETLSRTHLALSNISKIDGYEGLKGSELQELNSFLRINDDSNPAIMHRTTTETVDLKWVCKNHIFRNGQWMLRDAVNKNGGELDSKIGRVIIALKSRDRAKEFFNGLRPVYELDITFGWDWTVTDLEVFENALKASNVSILRLRLGRSQEYVATEPTSIFKRYEILVRIIELSNMRTIHIALSLGLIKLSGLRHRESSHLHKLSFEMNAQRVDANGLQLIVNSLKASTALTILDLKGSSMGVEGAVALSESLKVNTVLATLNLGGNSIGDEGAVALSEALKINTALAILDLSDNSIRKEGAIALSEALKINMTLINLDLFRNSIGKEGAAALSKVLMVNTALTTLELGNSSIEDEGVVALSEALKVNSTLTTLGLWGNSIGNEGAVALSEALKLNTALTTLGIWDNSIGDEGAVSLSEALKVNTALTTLHMQRNSIGKKGVVVLSEALKINTTLTTLDIGGSPIGVGSLVLSEALKTNAALTLYK